MNIGWVSSDRVSRMILAILILSPTPLGGESLYEHLRRLGVDVSRASFYRRLRKLVEQGLVLPLKVTNKETFRGPYTVRPSLRHIVKELERNPRFLDELEEFLAKHACLYVKALENGDLAEAYMAMDVLGEYFARHGKALLYMMVNELFTLKKAFTHHERADPRAKKLAEGLSKLPKDASHEVAQMGIVRALIPSTILFLIQIPIKALYKAIVKEECGTK
jgi:DNA-binding PadR family transcriptional regulator